MNIQGFLTGTCLVWVILSGCNTSSVSMDHAGDEARIRVRMEAQERAWNQGDLEGFMSAYWASDSLLFVGSRGPSYGWQTTLDNYKKGYPNAEAMGQLTFGIKNVDFVSDDVALMVGSWNLDGRGELEPLAGWFSLVWRQINGDWVIVRDHSS